MQARGYATRLVRGSESADEGTMDDLAERMGVRPTLVASMRRDPGPGDARALGELVRILRRDRPALVHTHAAKGGTLGRVAVMLAFPRGRPAVVHTFHGHSLTGYFSSRTARLYTRIERFLARRTDVLIAVSTRSATTSSASAWRRREVRGCPPGPRPVGVHRRRRSRRAPGGAAGAVGGGRAPRTW